MSDSIKSIESDDIVTEAAETVESETDPPMSLRAFIDEVLDHREYACSAPEYLLRAIEHFGTREVTEHGQQLDRYRFFDDPANDGEHAILGNTALLNDFVEDVRQLADATNMETKMFWFEGPTATGKSELKRCLINGINAFSRTDEGKRFTLEWNITGSEPRDAIGYGSAGSDDDSNWYTAPVQTNPLSVLPEDVRRLVLYGSETDDDLVRWIPTDLDPFSQETYDELFDRYDGDFESIVSDDHCRVTRYEVEVGRGIGTLQSEDDGRPPHKLVGEWMQGMVERLDSRGRRNPQAFAYDGVLSQGNGGLTVIEDASYHFDTIRKMLSVPEDDAVKIDRRTVLPVDTVTVIISNPDMRDELMKTAHDGNDSYRPIRRRLNRYQIGYLVTPSIEAELLYRLLTGYESVWTDEDRWTEAVQRNDVEIAPHALEAAAMYDVITRIDPLSIDGGDQLDKALIYEGETVTIDGEEYDFGWLQEVNPGSIQTDGRGGLPCTFTYDVIADAVADADDLVMPSDVIDAISEAMMTSTVFADDEVREYASMENRVGVYVLEQQERDVLDAMLREHTVGDDEIAKYIEHVYCWGTDESSVEPDETFMKVFEVEHLGRFGDSHYSIDSESGVSNEVEEFRQDVIDGVAAYLYEHRDDYGVDLDDVPPAELPQLQELVSQDDWVDVNRVFEDLDLHEWIDPLDGTETATVKEQTVQNMVEMFDYSEQSARETSEVVVDFVLGDDPGPAPTGEIEPIGGDE